MNRSDEERLPLGLGLGKWTDQTKNKKNASLQITRQIDKMIPKKKQVIIRNISKSTDPEKSTKKLNKTKR